MGVARLFEPPCGYGQVIHATMCTLVWPGYSCHCVGVARLFMPLCGCGQVFMPWYGCGHGTNQCVREVISFLQMKFHLCGMHAFTVTSGVLDTIYTLK